MAKRHRRKKAAASLPVLPRKGPPVNLRPGGAHANKKEDVLEREARREMNEES